ncbi:MULTISPECIES: LacI family DNA-binding transcriptional regulator [unclassified Serinicoccus]|uniref:LacI family DNA-binding transcriptional regulator n=1 Tax=unclassified Serinicoccus TaxID=2643101 RepID=UPI0038531E3F
MVTSRDVAKLAGVSQPTVSRALRDDPRLSPATKDVVRKAARQLGYATNAIGRALATGRSTRVGLLVTDLQNEFYPHVIAPMHHELAELGHELVLITETVEAEVIAERIVAHGLCGVILATPRLESLLPVRLDDKGIPFVYFNRVSSLVHADSVTVDPSVGFADLADALVRLGHTRIGAVFGPQDTSTGALRERAVRAALAARGLGFDEADVRHGDFDFEVGHTHGRDLLGSSDRPSVIICANDIVALGVLNAAAEEGLEVPADVSVVGFDDLPIAGWPLVQMTTIRYDLDAMSRSAARLMVRRVGLADGAEPTSETFPTAYVERRTLGAAPPS